MHRRWHCSFFLGCLLITSCGKNVQLQQILHSDAAVLKITPSSTFQFPTEAVGGSASQSFEVTNTGQQTATSLKGSFGLSVTFQYTGGFPGAGGTCAGSLAAGESCTVVVTFAPVYTGTFQQVLAVSYTDGYETQLTDLPVMIATSP